MFKQFSNNYLLFVLVNFQFHLLFSCQNVVLDVCSLDQNLGLLQQGCDITSGLYLKLSVARLPGLLQYLLVRVKQLTQLLPWPRRYQASHTILPHLSICCLFECRSHNVHVCPCATPPSFHWSTPGLLPPGSPKRTSFKSDPPLFSLCCLSQFFILLVLLCYYPYNIYLIPLLCIFCQSSSILQG